MPVFQIHPALQKAAHCSLSVRLSCGAPLESESPLAQVQARLARRRQECGTLSATTTEDSMTAYDGMREGRPFATDRNHRSYGHRS